MNTLENDLKRMKQTYETSIKDIEKSLRIINVNIREEDGKYKPFLEVINEVQKALSSLGDEIEDKI